MSTSHESQGEAPPPPVPTPSTTTSSSQNRISFSERLGTAASLGSLPSKDISFKFAPANKTPTPAPPLKPIQPRAHPRQQSSSGSSRSASGTGFNNIKNVSRSTNEGSSSAYMQSNKPLPNRTANERVPLENLLGTSEQRRVAPLSLTLSRNSALGAASPPTWFQEKQPRSAWTVQREDTVSADNSRPSSSAEEVVQMDVDQEARKDVQSIQGGVKSSSNVEREVQPRPAPARPPRAAATTHIPSRASPFAFNDQSCSSLRKRGSEEVIPALDAESRRRKVPAVAQHSSPAPSRPPSSSHGAAYMPPQSRPSGFVPDLRSAVAPSARSLAQVDEVEKSIQAKFFGMPNNQDENGSEHLDDADLEFEAEGRIQSELRSLKKLSSVMKELESQTKLAAELEAQLTDRNAEIEGLKDKSRDWIAKAQKVMASANESMQTVDSLKNDHAADSKRVNDILSTIHDLRKQYSKLSCGTGEGEAQEDQEAGVAKDLSIASLRDTIETARTSLQLCDQLQIRLADGEELLKSEREKATQALYDRAEVQEQLKTLQGTLSTLQNEIKLATQTRKVLEAELAEAKSSVATMKQKLRAEEDLNVASTALAVEKEKRLVVAAEHEEELNATIQDLRASAVQQQTDLDQQRKQVEELRNSLSQTQSALRVSQTNLTNETQSVEQQRDTLTKLQEIKYSQEKDIAALQKEKHGVEVCLSALQMAHDTQTKADQQRIERLQAEVDKRDPTTVETIRSSLNTSEQRCANAEAEVKRIKLLNDTLQPQVVELQSSLKLAKHEAEVKAGEVTSAKSEVAQEKQDKTRLAAELTTSKMSNSNLSGRLEQVEQDRNKLKLELEQSQKMLSQRNDEAAHAMEQAMAEVEQLRIEKNAAIEQARLSKQQAELGHAALQREHTLQQRWHTGTLTSYEAQTFEMVSQELGKKYAKETSRKDNELKRQQHDHTAVLEKLGAAQKEIARLRNTIQRKENVAGSLATQMQKRTILLSSEESSSPSSHNNEQQQQRRPSSRTGKAPTKAAVPPVSTQGNTTAPQPSARESQRATRTYAGRNRSSAVSEEQQQQNESTTKHVLGAGTIEEQQAPTSEKLDEDAVTNDDDSSEVSNTPKPLTAAQRTGGTRSGRV